MHVALNMPYQPEHLWLASQLPRGQGHPSIPSLPRPHDVKDMSSGETRETGLRSTLAMAILSATTSTLVASSPDLLGGATAPASPSSRQNLPACSLLLSSSSSWRISGLSYSKLESCNRQSERYRGRRRSAFDSSSIVSMASNSNKKVFVAGATGQTGNRVVNELLAHGYEVRAGVRDIAKAKDRFPKNDKLELVTADVTQAETLSKAIAGSDAVIVATGFRPSIDLTTSWKVDNIGTCNVVDACQQSGVKRMVLVSSILANGYAIGKVFNPVYILLNIFGLTLVAKHQAENYIRKSGIDYTIIRPGGLKNDPPSGNIVIAKEDTLFGGSVSRDTVAKVAVESLSIPEASFKVVELILTPDAPSKSIPELFREIS